MPNLDFFAVGADIAHIFDFIYTETDCRVYQSYSDFGQNLREFTSTDQVVTTYEKKLVTYKQGHSILLQLWSPSVSSEVRIKRIELDADKCSGHKFRFRIEGWGLIQLYLGGESEKEITNSHYGHNSLKRAQRWENTYCDELGLVANWNWDLLTKLSGKIQYHIKKRLAVSKFGSRPILPEAQKKLAQGYSIRS